MEDAYLSVDLLTMSINSKGEEEKKETPLVKYAILSSAQREQLVEDASLLQEAIREFQAAELAEADEGEQIEDEGE